MQVSMKPSALGSKMFTSPTNTPYTLQHAALSQHVKANENDKLSVLLVRTIIISSLNGAANTASENRSATQPISETFNISSLNNTPIMTMIIMMAPTPMAI